MSEAVSVATKEAFGAFSCLPLSDITKLEWGNTSITKKSYVVGGFTAISAAGPDGFLDHFEWSGDGVILSAIGARCGRCFYVSGKWTAIKNTIVIQGDPAKVNHKFLCYYLNDARKWKISGSGQPFITLKTARETAVPFPSLEVQIEIVAELEKQFSRLDEAVANLQRVKANLKRYKASVLKAAVEGRLVENEATLARREGRTYETGEQLLYRILDERQARLAGKAKFKIPKRPSDSNLPELPEGWIWSSFEAVADRVTVGHVGSMKNEYVEKGVPFLRSQNVRPNRFDPEGLKFITDEFHASLAKSALSPGDIAVVRSGSVGVSCVIPDTLPVANCSDLVIIKSPRGVESHYGAYYLNSVVESRIAAGRVGVALVHFNTQSVAELPLPLPPMAEQRRIAAEVDRHLSIIREVEVEVDANLQRAQALRQATLAKSFVHS